MKTITLWELIDLGCPLEIIEYIMNVYKISSLDNNDIKVISLLKKINFFDSTVFVSLDIIDLVLEKYKQTKFCILYDIFSMNHNRDTYFNVMSSYERFFEKVDSYWIGFYDIYLEKVKAGIMFSDSEMVVIEEKLNLIESSFKHIIILMLSFKFSLIYDYFYTDEFSDIIKNYFGS
jgi:hypothetical protein